jgi:hypothetical protein
MLVSFVAVAGGDWQRTDDGLGRLAIRPHDGGAGLGNRDGDVARSVAGHRCSTRLIARP